MGRAMEGFTRLPALSEESMMTVFREGGPESPVSMRRVLAAFFALAGVAVGFVGLGYAAAGWFVFIPSALCIVATLLLLFFTTWADVADVISKAKG